MPQKTKGAFAFKDTSSPGAPTRIYVPGEGLRDAKDGEDLRRSWTKNPPYVDTIPLDQPGYHPSLSRGPAKADQEIEAPPSEEVDSNDGGATATGPNEG